MRERSEQASGGENTFVPVRTRYFDDVLLGAVERGSVAQVVLLGAGMDTRAFRLPLPEYVQFFELDRAEVLNEKDVILAEIGARPRCRRHVMPVDLTRPWSSPLQAAGFDPGAATAWVAEGLLFYLTEESVGAVLGDAADLSAQHSLFAADVFGTGVRSLPMMRPYLSWLESTGSPQPFCTDDPASLFASCGWQPEHLTSPGNGDANYGRVPIGLRGSPAVGSTSRASLVIARRT
jgi:methyltransferase (TIGR00027 family)